VDGTGAPTVVGAGLVVGLAEEGATTEDADANAGTLTRRMKRTTASLPARLCRRSE
jgi:hypothetical protein